MNIFLDEYEELEIRDGGNMPHWFQKNKVQFVTFRLADSLPHEKSEEILQQAESFRKCNPEPWDSSIQRRYRRILSMAKERMIDRGYGSCVLKDVSVRKLLVDAIMFKDDVDYEVLAFVIMPNHVHLLLIPFNDSELYEIIGSIKKYSARKINQLLGRSGSLWMRESYCHIERNEDELKHHYTYIRNNPKTLDKSEFTLYIRSGVSDL